MRFSLRVAVLAGILAAGFFAMGTTPAKAQGYYGYGRGYHGYHGGYGHRPYGYGGPAAFRPYPYYGGYGYGVARPIYRPYPYAAVPYGGVGFGVGLGGGYVPGGWGYPVAPIAPVYLYW